MLKHLLSSLHSAKDQLGKRGINPAGEFSYGIHFTPFMSFDQPVAASGHPLLTSHPQHTRTHTPLFLLPGLQCFQQEKNNNINNNNNNNIIIIKKIAIIKKSTVFTSFWYITLAFSVHNPRAPSIYTVIHKDLFWGAWFSWP